MWVMLARGGEDDGAEQDEGNQRPPPPIKEAGERGRSPAVPRPDRAAQPAGEGVAGVCGDGRTVAPASSARRLKSSGFKPVLYSICSTARSVQLSLDDVRHRHAHGRPVIAVRLEPRSP